jgi:hypothetical protein
VLLGGLDILRKLAEQLGVRLCPFAVGCETSARRPEPRDSLIRTEQYPFQID